VWKSVRPCDQNTSVAPAATRVPDHARTTLLFEDVMLFFFAFPHYDDIYHSFKKDNDIFCC
jgi:hypothetical protein